MSRKAGDKIEVKMYSTFSEGMKNYSKKEAAQIIDKLSNVFIGKGEISEDMKSKFDKLPKAKKST